MKFLHAALPGVIVVEPQIHRDARGVFFEWFHADRYREAGIGETFVQINQSLSMRGTIRGLHAQWRRPQAKLIRVLDGAVWDVVADIRRGSPTFGRWAGIEVSAENGRQVYVPRGYAHGFAVIGERAAVEYACSDYYDPGGELAIAWNDPQIGVTWPLTEPVLSPRDAQAPRLADVMEQLPVFTAPK